MKKILYVITLPEIGGAQKYVLDLACNLKDKYEVMVASGGKLGSPLFQKLEQEKIEYYPLKHLKREIDPLHDILAVFEMRKLIKMFKPDIIHLNSSKAGVIGSLGSVGLKTKVIYTAHGFVFNEPMNIIKKKIYLYAEKFSAIYKNKIIAISEKDKQIGIKNKIAPKEKFVTIQNGLNLNDINFLSKEESRRELNLSQNHKVIGVIANYYPTKALHRLIEAAGIIIQDFNNAKFILIGDGPQRKSLEEQIKKMRLTNNFLFGPIKNAARYLKALDVFVLPSVKEGFPYAILEAMAAEEPIVATKVGGVPEIITDGENGFLVESVQGKVETKTIKKIAEKTIYYLKQPEIAEIFTTNAYKKLINKFTLEQMIQKTEEVYNRPVA